MTSARFKPWMLAYAAITLTWGFSFLLVTWSLPTFTPLGLALGRSILAATSLLIVCAVMRTRLPPRALWPHLAVYGFLIAVAPWLAIGIAVSHTTTSLVAIVGSTTPIWVLLVNVVFFPEQRPNLLRVSGIFVGFLGILIVIGVWNGVGSATAIGMGAQLIGAILFAISLPYSHRYLTGGRQEVSISPVALSAGVFIIATIETVPLVLVFGGIQGPVVPSAVAGILIIGLIGGGLVTVMILYLIKQTDSTTVSSITYLLPVVATVAGVLLLGEALNWYFLVGAAVVMLGAALTQGAWSPRPEQAPSGPAP